MAAYDSLKSLVQQAIRTNGNNEITGQVLQNVLMAMIDELGGENGYAGVATPSTNPGAPDGKVFYFATEAGTYTHFDGATLAKGIHLMVFNGVTWSHQTLYTIDSEVTSGSNNLITSGAVYTKIINAINALDATVSKSAGADGLSLSLTETDGKVTNISGSIAPQTYDAYGAASAAQSAASTDATNKVNAAKTQILGDAASDYNTLGKLEDKIQAEASRAAAAENALNTDKADKATTLAGYGINDAYTKTEVNGLVSTPHQNYVTVPTYASLPATGSADTIYRVSNYNGSTSQVDASVYSEYAWNGSGYTFLRVDSQIGEVFDITVYNSNTKYADLAAALGTNGANVPSSIRRGGMSVKFVQSSDNKYVQYRLMNQYWSITVEDWQGVDLEPTANSKNLVESNGVSEYVNSVISAQGSIQASTGSSADWKYINLSILSDTSGILRIDVSTAPTKDTAIHAYNDNTDLGQVAILKKNTTTISQQVTFASAVTKINLRINKEDNNGATWTASWYSNSQNVKQIKEKLQSIPNDVDRKINLVQEVNSGNNFSINVLSGYWDTNSGGKQNYVTALGCTEKFLATEGEELSVANQFTTNVSFLFWDKTGSYLGYTNISPNESAIAPNNTYYCALNYYLSEGVSSITLAGTTRFQANTNECVAKVNNVVTKTNLFNGVVHSGIHSQRNGDMYGTATANDSYFYTDLIPVEGIEKLYMLSGFQNTRTLYVTFFNELRRVVGGVNNVFQILTPTDFPVGTKYFIVTSNIADKDTLMIYTSVPDEYISYNAYKVDSYNNIPKKYRRIDRGVVENKYSPNEGNPVYPLLDGNNLFCSYLIDLTGISKISYINLSGFKLLTYVNGSGVIISGGTVSINANTKGTLTVPNNAVACIYYTGTGGDPATQFTLVAGETIPERVYGFDEIVIDGLKLEGDYLFGKTIVFDGDSITEGAGVTDIPTGIGPNNNKGWGYWVQRNHPGATVYGYGQSGFTVGKREGYNDSLLNHISQYPNDVDLFVLSGGYNDQARQMAMGEIVPVTDGSDSYFNETFDQYTFCGALEYWFQQLRSDYPFAQIVYIITPKRVYSSDPLFNLDTKGVQVKGVLYSTGQERMELFWQKIREVCDKWAIKYLDLSKTSGVVGTGEITDPGLTIGKRYFSVNNGVPDFTHPNTNYYKKLLVPQIENLIRSVVY